MSDKKIVSKSKDAYIKRKKDMNFQSVESMQSVVNVVNEAAAALNDKRRTIRESAIPEVLAGALGAGIGGVGSFAALYSLGVAVSCRYYIWSGNGRYNCWWWNGSWSICACSTGSRTCSYKCRCCITFKK